MWPPTVSLTYFCEEVSFLTLKKIPCLKHLSKSKFKIIPPATQIETSYFFQQWSFMWNTHHSPCVSRQKRSTKCHGVISAAAFKELEEEQQEVQKLLQRTGFQVGFFLTVARSVAPGHRRGAEDPAAPLFRRGRILRVRRSCVSILGKNAGLGTGVYQAILGGSR